MRRWCHRPFLAPEHRLGSSGGYRWILPRHLKWFLCARCHCPCAPRGSDPTTEGCSECGLLASRPDIEAEDAVSGWREGAGQSHAGLQKTQFTTNRAPQEARGESYGRRPIHSGQVQVERVNIHICCERQRRWVSRRNPGWSAHTGSHRIGGFCLELINRSFVVFQSSKHNPCRPASPRVRPW